MNTLELVIEVMMMKMDTGGRLRWWFSSVVVMQVAVVLVTLLLHSYKNLVTRGVEVVKASALRPVMPYHVVLLYFRQALLMNNNHNFSI